MALTLPVFILDKFTFATPTSWDNWFKDILRSAITRSNLNTIAIVFSLQS
ncbi:protein of unknown function [Listeria monocytogenes R479a]|nr:protein of unknown function [Listeria monocytogenes R479a]